MDKLFTKRHTTRFARVAQKHLAKPEPQRIQPKHRLRPLDESEREEILNRVKCGDALRNIASEMGIPYPLVFRLVRKNGIYTLTGIIQHIRVFVEDNKAVAVLMLDGVQFIIGAETYPHFVRVIDQAYINHLPLYLVAQWADESFSVLHLALAKAGRP